TSAYCPPRSLTPLSRKRQADVYSFGLILWEMLSLRRPFEGLNRKEFVQTVIKGGGRPPLQQEWSGALRELMRRCWDEDMDTRPEFEEVEDALLQITHREATWGGMLSGSTPAAASGAVPPTSSASSAPVNGRNNGVGVSGGGGGGGGSGGVGSINGRPAGSSKSQPSSAAAAGRGNGGDGLVGGVGSSMGVGGDILPETRTLV
ncbi:unnamed protein product, partial [Hapterophycus canaliculatus]